MHIRVGRSCGLEDEFSVNGREPEHVKEHKKFASNKKDIGLIKVAGLKKKKKKKAEKKKI